GLVLHHTPDPHYTVPVGIRVPPRGDTTLRLLDSPAARLSPLHISNPASSAPIRLPASPRCDTTSLLPDNPAARLALSRRPDPDYTAPGHFPALPRGETTLQPPHNPAARLSLCIYQTQPPLRPLVSLLGKLPKEFDRLNIVAALVRSARVIKRVCRDKTTGCE